MDVKKYTARKLQPKSKSDAFWVLEFRHPLIKDSSGKTGKKIRKGLGTKDEVKAEELVQQMNTLLSDAQYWEPSARQLAQQRLDASIVDIFYEGVNYLLKDYESVRNGILPIKNRESGYSSVLLLGATGAGKTTLLRQLMGTNPITERFPATSTARTTVFDTEIILSEGLYKGVVSFFTENETRQMIKDTIHKSMTEYFSRKDDQHLQRVFLEDKDQRFKLGYILGKIQIRSIEDYEFDEEENESIIETFIVDNISVSEDEQKGYESKINDFLQEIKKITADVVHATTTEYLGNNSLSEDEKNILEEIILSNLEDYDGDDLYNLIDEIIDEIKARFKQLNTIELVTEKFGWPIHWHLETSDRSVFLQSIRFFSSNYSALFGKLLTPLVSGMRVEGPFKPDYLDNIPKLVIFDGEGLGHISDTNTNLPFKTIKKFEATDAIVLVDNSQNPMLATSYAVIKSVAITGHSDKLFICFTHFDAVKGDNLPKRSDKINHVFGSVDHLLGRLKSEMDYEVNKFFIDQLHKCSYYLANIDEKLNDDKKYKPTINDLRKFINSLELAIVPVQSSCQPTYDISTLIFKIRKAAVDFDTRWKGYLYGSPAIPKEHFSRIKALSLRLGYRGDTEYKELMPISDFGSYFNSQISNFLSSPADWHPSNPTDEEKQKCINDIKQSISKKMFDYALKAIKLNKIAEWQNAYNYKGKGSAELRAAEIKKLYNEVAPIPKDELTQQSKQFLKDIMELIVAAIKESDGKVISMYSEMSL
ncbi:MAG: hypothetical protein BGO70_14310 [Bacteroidetes bacterium 43-93]|nr:hypothetical protein [Bacteroidota bacterium]OJW99598.1 MAG: hypothetical protein BGO70_14310 [Bacteroidetes bacterium 43-93]